MSTDWMPSRREEQIAMARQWFEFFTNGSFPKWGITAQDAAAVGFIVHNIETAEAESRATGGGTVVMGRLRDLYDELRALMRRMHRMITAHPLTHEELAILGLRARDTTPTPVPVPTGVPEIETDTATIRELGFRFRETGAHTFARPEHVAMIEFRWHLRETRPEHIAELTNIETFSSGPITLPFDELKRGQRVFFAARWLNARGEGGPWSDIESAVIP